MAKLHELLAVEGDNERIAKKVTSETAVAFTKKQNLFEGFERKLELFADTGEDTSGSDEHMHMETTVQDRLTYTARHLGKYWDTVYRKDCTNQKAVADIKVGDKVIAVDVPATFLLGLEKKLEHFRGVLDAAPTLPPGTDWEPALDIGTHVHRAVTPERRYKTAKTTKSKVLYEATEHHPAQIDKWDETVNIGLFTRNFWSGKMSSAEKAALMERVDKLIGAVKTARQRANQQVVETKNIAGDLFDYIFEV